MTQQAERSARKELTHVTEELKEVRRQQVKSESVRAAPAEDVKLMEQQLEDKDRQIRTLTMQLAAIHANWADDIEKLHQRYLMQVVQARSGSPPQQRDNVAADWQSIHGGSPQPSGGRGFSPQAATGGSEFSPQALGGGREPSPQGLRRRDLHNAMPAETVPGGATPVAAARVPAPAPPSSGVRAAPAQPPLAPVRGGPTTAEKPRANRRELLDNPAKET